MNDISKFSVFDFIVYLIPGLFFILYLGLTIPNFLYIDTLTEYFIAILFAFLIGNIFHQFAFIPTQFLWFIYSLFKESDSEGHGVKTPKYPWGKFAKFLRYSFLEPQRSNKLTKNANTLIVTRYELDEKDYLGIFYFKELLFINNPEARKGFEYLHYQGLFCKSMSFCLFLISMLTIVIIYIGDFAIYRNNTKVIDFEGFGVATVVVTLILSAIFVKRYKFFETFRKQIVDANLINTFYKEKK